MRYLPLTPDERQKILDTCGVKSFQELTAQIPESLRVKGLLDLEAPLSESELLRHIGELADKNKAAHMVSFLGQGVYDHSWPRVIDQIQNRGEFLTAYTPYQPEISQGTLQMIFEYQSMLADLTGMEVSNASLYDGATSVVEGVLMAARLQGLKCGRVIVSEGTYQRFRDVLSSYLEPLGFTIETWRANAKTFCSDTASAAALPTSDQPIAAVVMQSPNTWGLVEDWRELSGLASALKTKSVAVVSHAHSLALYAPPGAHFVDIVTGELQTLGVPVGFGGPHLGLLCCRKADVRQMPGRLVGKTLDAKGQRAFCITLATREQHIRREKATSNICSNQNLMAMRACMYMTLMGPEGLKKVAGLSRSRAWWARTELSKRLAQSAPDVKIVEGEVFNEFTLLVPAKRALWIDEVRTRGEAAGIMAGVQVPVPVASGFMGGLAVAFTEQHIASEIEQLMQVIAP